jgi:hypothetical protein
LLSFWRCFVLLVTLFNSICSSRYSIILFTLFCSPFCVVPLSSSHYYTFLHIVLFSLSCCGFSSLCYCTFLFTLLRSLVHVILFSYWQCFDFLFTLLCSPLYVNWLSFALLCSPFCIVLLSSLHSFPLQLFSYFKHKVLHTTIIFFTLLLLVCCYSLKNIVLPPYIPSCKSWEWLRIDNWPLVCFSLCFLSHVFCSFVLIFFCFGFVVHGLLWVVFETNINPCIFYLFCSIIFLLASKYFIIFYLCLLVNVLNHF